MEESNISGTSRRTVVKTAAWAVPAVAVVAGAPQFAASHGALNFTFTVATSQGPDGAGDFDDLMITVDNTASDLDLSTTQVRVMLNGTIPVATQAGGITPAGTASVVYASETQAVPAGLSLAFEVTFLDANGVTQVVSTSPLITSGTEGQVASFNHASTHA